MPGRVQLQRPVALPVRALDGRSTTVRLPGASTVGDLKAALLSSFPPAQAAPDFHLFLRGGKLLPDAKLSSLSVAPGEFVSLISFSTSVPAPPPRSTPAPSPSSPAAAPNPRPQKRKFFTSSWRKIAGVPKNNPAPPPPPPSAGDPDPAFAASARKRKFFESSWSGADVFARVAGLPINDPTSPAFYCHGEQPLGPAQMVAHLKQGLGRHGQIRHAREIPGRQASFRPLPAHLSPPTRRALDAIGVTRLYSHQAQAIAAVSGGGGKHVVVATSTSSGKSLCYNVPVLESLSSSNSTACALYVFPTKALAQDQLNTLLHMTSTNTKQGNNSNKFHVSIYDGDTPFKDPAKIRDKARLVITNPDMLHVSILPSHAQFTRILSNLEYIVIDEAHSYKGAFGCHVALTLRRLKRICADVYGTHPKFVFCTATLANPREHVAELAGLDGENGVELVDGDGSPCGAKHFLLWSPSVARGPKERRPSPVHDVSHLFAEMVQHGLRCIAFCKTKKLCEAVLARTREILEENASPELADAVCVYRGGYAADDRRRIEAGLFGGTLRGVAATNALELGIDVGHIDATLHLGFPGSVASFWQQAGRSGRRSKESIAVYVGFEGALDQYFINFPEKLFGKPVERCHVDSRNPKILGQHLACAAFEKPLCPERDQRYFGSGLRSAMVVLKEKGRLLMMNNNNNSSADGESRAVSIRAIEHDRYKVIDKQGYRVLEEIEESKAFFQVYEGAVYMHQGHSYLVERLDHSSRTAYCRAAADVKYYTKIQYHTEITVLLEGEAALLPPAATTSASSSTTAQANNCKVTTEWVSFDRVWKSSNNVFSGSTVVDLPPYSFDTQAAWVSIPRSVRAAVEQTKLGFQGGVHAASHALLNIAPLHMMCSTCDLATECPDPQQTASKPPDRILLYDKHPGGIGLASQVKLLFGELMVAALQLISTCGCTNLDGCPNCIQSFACGGYNKNLDKAAAVLVLKGVIENERLFF
ncbi:unnamed protein product [Urochloa humidicola]